MADLPLFQQIKLPAPPSHDFDLSFSNHLTTDFGRITPILVKETLPADVVKELGTELFIRSLPLATPTMGRMKAYVHGFFVPNRIMWSHWERFISGWDGITIADQTDPVPPFIDTEDLDDAHELQNGKLCDYLGIPTDAYTDADDVKVLAFRFNAYNRIYDEWYRDENLENPWTWDLVDGSSNPPTWDYCKLKYRAYKKDYFTSALPWPQRGSQMTFPLGVSAPVKADTSNITGDSVLRLYADNVLQGGDDLHIGATVPAGKFHTLDVKDGIENQGFSPLGNISGFVNSDNGKVSNLYADLAAANVLTVNEFRRTMALQRWLETNARGGSRYNETLYAHFGVKIPDYRINRSQYLGGSSIQFNVDPIAQTSSTAEEETPAGTLFGKASAYGYLGILDQPFRPMEHGVLMLLLTIMAEPIYFQGISRFLTKMDKFDYAWPEFAHLGEQEIKKSEIFVSGSNSDDETFGYQSRFAEYKYSENELHGDLRNMDAYASWITAFHQTSQPTLSNAFIKCTPAKHAHIFAYPENTYDNFIVECYNHFKVERPLPIFGTPE